MFGIHKKLFLILALVSMCLGIIALAIPSFELLRYFDFLKDNTEDEILSLYMVIRLVALILMLLSVALYLRPKMKLMKVLNKISDQYRYDLYNLILMDSSKKKIDIRSVTFEEAGERLTFTPKSKKETLVFEDLTTAEATYITLNLMREFSYAMYAKVENDKNGKPSRKLSNTALIDEFKVNYIYQNGVTQTKEYIKDYKYINIKKVLLWKRSLIK